VVEDRSAPPVEEYEPTGPIRYGAIRYGADGPVNRQVLAVDSLNAQERICRSAARPTCGAGGGC
jgi:hypothetical protein